MKNVLTVCLVLFLVGSLFFGIFYSGCPKGDSARFSQVRKDLTVLSVSVDSFSMLTGKFPTQEEGLEILLTKRVMSSDSEELVPLLEELPLDPWGSAYVYLSSEAFPEIISLGPDKVVSEDDLSS